LSQKPHVLVNEVSGLYKRVAVFGAGLSGRSAQSLAVGLGMEVCLFDEGGQGDSAEFNRQSLEGFDAFIFSPGFAETHPWRVLAERSSKPCYGELGFAASHWNGRLMGVTGTNGKTSLTSLLARALRVAGVHAIEAGNIGLPLSDFVLGDSNTAEAYAVCEISSFQAELPLGLQLDALIWTNFAEDHLDRYRSMEEYFAAKQRLIGCLSPGAPAFVGTSVHRFDASVSDPTNVFPVSEDSDRIQQLVPESPFCNYPQSANFILAEAFWDHFEFPAKSLIESADKFQLAAHRLSMVSEWGGVQFWSDSKATNFHAALAAMDAVGRDHGIYWIGGGSYKGGDLERFARTVAPKIKAAFLYGSVAEEMAGYFSETGSRFAQHFDFVEAVKASAEAALQDAPSIVLLSPGFASFDQFPGYAARGDTFETTILKLKDSYCID